MDPSHCLLALLLTLPAILHCLPGAGEKLRINPDEVERVVQLSNMTKRDPTAKNVNFAWKMTVRSTIPTTQDPARTTTLDPELSKRNNEIYDKLFAQLAYTLRDKVYLNRWLTEMDKGYHIFLYEIQKQEKAHYFFKPFYDEPVFVGEEGDELMRFMNAFLVNLGSKDKFVMYAEEMKSNPHTGGEEFFIRKPTASEENRNASKAYNIMQVHFALAFRADLTRKAWMDAFSGGFDNLIKSLQEKGPKSFLIRVEGDNTLKGAKGGVFWDAVIGYLKRLGKKGFNKLFKKATHLPDNITGSEMLEKKMLDISTSNEELQPPTSLTTLLSTPQKSTNVH